MTKRGEQIAEMYVLVYGYTPAQARAQVELFEIETLRRVILRSRGMNPSREHAKGALTMRRKEWWGAGVAQVHNVVRAMIRERGQEQ